MGIVDTSQLPLRITNSFTKNTYNNKIDFQSTLSEKIGKGKRCLRTAVVLSPLCNKLHCKWQRHYIKQDEHQIYIEKGDIQIRQRKRLHQENQSVNPLSTFAEIQNQQTKYKSTSLLMFPNIILSAIPDSSFGFIVRSQPLYFLPNQHLKADSCLLLS